ILDGQWGDYLQLRAVSNVVGSTIKVLSIRNRDVVWMSIESYKDNHSSNRVLTVGSVGEHHYSSLWPSDTGEVAMFASGYVDPVSRVPSCHLSFLLNAVAPRRTVLDVSAIISSHILERTNGFIER
ncbi:hypothetical protein MAR_020228, partial [Mya arenaria]